MMTEEQVTTATTDDDTTATLTVPARDLGRVLYNASLFVSKDSLRRVLQHVCLEVSQRGDETGGPTTAYLTARATDSYVLGEDGCRARDGGAIVRRVYLLPPSDLAPITKALLAKRSAPMDVTLTLGETSITITLPMLGTDGASFTVQHYNGGEFPNTDLLWPKQDPDPIALNPHALATLAKVLSATTEKPSKRTGTTEPGMLFTFYGDTRPILAERRESGASFRALVMPIRLDS